MSKRFDAIPLCSKLAANAPGKTFLKRETFSTAENGFGCNQAKALQEQHRMSESSYLMNADDLSMDEEQSAVEPSLRYRVLDDSFKYLKTGEGILVSYESNSGAVTGSSQTEEEGC
ncbi:hypothetical protein RUM44_004447 [Polyplax serrata]|uniref:Uncharacterized protein n=1 Tax=Polyplax serrata TaxID=468196 RepID=A0ABR1B2V5_POLSC